MRIVVKGNSLVAQIIYDADEAAFSDDGNIMGVDFGIKCPVVSYCSDGNVKFYGNGRKNKYMHRKLGKAKKPDAIKHINNKEQRVMKNVDHKTSHDIVATAVAHNVKVIKLEQLQNIRSTTRTSCKNGPSLYTWSVFLRCPVCGSVHHAADRNYTCECGFHIHRDVLGAINICNSTEYVGNSNIRHTV